MDTKRAELLLGGCGHYSCDTHVISCDHLYRENEFSFVEGAIKGGAGKLFKMKVRLGTWTKDLHEYSLIPRLHSSCLIPRLHSSCCCAVQQSWRVEAEDYLSVRY